MHCYTVDGSKLEESDFKLGGVHGGPIYSVACSPDGKLIATTGASKKIHITSTAKGGETLNSFGWEYHNARINSIAFSPDSSKLVSASMDQTIIVWKDLDKFDAKSRERFTCHIAGVNEAMWLDNDTIVRKTLKERLMIMSYRISESENVMLFILFAISSVYSP